MTAVKKTNLKASQRNQNNESVVVLTFSCAITLTDSDLLGQVLIYLLIDLNFFKKVFAIPGQRNEIP